MSGIADLLADRQRLVDACTRAPSSGVARPISCHRGLEARAVLGGVDRLDARADQLDAEPVEHAGVVELDGEVQRGLPAERRKQRVGPLALDDRGSASSTSSGST